MIRLIAFDLDGTALTSKKTLSPATIDAFRAAHKAGVALVPCTGRSLNHLSDALTNVMNLLGAEAFPYIIVDNGCQVFSVPRHEQLFTSCIPSETALAVLEEARTAPAAIYGSFGAEGVIDSKGRAWEDGEVRPFLQKYIDAWYIAVADLASLIEWNCGIVKFALTFASPSPQPEWLARFSRRAEVGVQYSELNNIEIAAPGISKGSALRFVSEHSGIPLSEFFAAGDSRNDLEMLQEAGFGVAMGNALPAVKSAARFVTDTNDNDGLAKAIRKALLSYSGLTRVSVSF